VYLSLGDGISGQDCRAVDCISAAAVSCATPGSDDSETDDIVGKITECVDYRY